MSRKIAWGIFLFGVIWCIIILSYIHHQNLQKYNLEEVGDTIQVIVND